MRTDGRSGPERQLRPEHGLCESRTSARLILLVTLVAIVLPLTATDPVVAYGMLSVVAVGHFFLYLFRCQCEARFPACDHGLISGQLVRRQIGFSQSDGVGSPRWTVYLWFKVLDLAPSGFDASFESEAEKLRWLAHNPTDTGERWHYRSFQARRDALAWMRSCRLGDQYPVRQHPHAKQEVVLVMDQPSLDLTLYQIGVGLIGGSVVLLALAKFMKWPGW